MPKNKKEDNSEDMIGDNGKWFEKMSRETFERLEKLEIELNEMQSIWLLAKNENEFMCFMRDKCINHQYNYDWESTIH